MASTYEELKKSNKKIILYNKLDTFKSLLDLSDLGTSLQGNQLHLDIPHKQITKHFKKCLG